MKQSIRLANLCILSTIAVLLTLLTSESSGLSWLALYLATPLLVGDILAQYYLMSKRDPASQMKYYLMMAVYLIVTRVAISLTALLSQESSYVPILIIIINIPVLLFVLLGKPSR